MTEKDYEMKSCRVFCEAYYPEDPDKLFKWFGAQPELFSFGMGGATDDDLNDGNAPSPILFRQGDTLYFNIGVEIKKEEFTGKRMFERRRYGLNLLTWECKDMTEMGWFRMLNTVQQ
jgi:hypothetical protein